MGSHSTQIYGPNLLLTDDIVFVCITYRVGFLGFLTLNDLSLDVPGNAGFKDQVLALKWIRRNIKHFNGDPNNVTVFGASAGAVSVELLMVSPTAKDLFHKAIIQSGSSLNTYARARFQSSDLALFLQEPGLSERELLNLLSEMPMKQLIEIQTKYLQSKNSPGNLGILGPIIEKPNPSAFLTKEPLDLIQSGDYHSVPVITGYNDNEGALYWYYDSINKRLKNCSIPFTLDHALPHETDLNDDEQVRKIKEVLKKYYLNEQNKTNTTLLMGDSYFVPSIIMSAKNQARISKNPVYLFRFALDTSLNRLKRLARLKCRGACHGDELGYFFTTSANNQLSELEKTAQRKLISLWTNFMKYGNPTPKGNDLNIEWKPIQKEKLNFLHIGNEFRMDVDPEADRMKIWDEIYKLNPRTAKY